MTVKELIEKSYNKKNIPIVVVHSVEFCARLGHNEIYTRDLNPKLHMKNVFLAVNTKDEDTAANEKTFDGYNADDYIPGDIVDIIYTSYIFSNSITKKETKQVQVIVGIKIYYKTKYDS